ncbi:hypothetical protein [uncultured Chryseobacterium sp.]|nr:hypothetical protein [uncultured Chryseobacterium sp.]
MSGLHPNATSPPIRAPKQGLEWYYTINSISGLLAEEQQVAKKFDNKS